MRFAHFLRGLEPLPRSDRIYGPMRLLGNRLHLIEFKLDGSFAAKHRYNHADRILVDLDALHGAGEAGQRTVEDPDGIADFVVVSMFGRETSVEFELDQIEVVSQ